MNVARAIMALAAAALGESRHDWALAMEAEFEAAEADGQGLRFAAGCLFTAARELVTREEGGFTLTSYALALGVMLPMAALQIGCALFGLPYLYPHGGGLTGALLEGQAHETLVRSIYQAAVPSLALILLLLGLGHLRIAWAMLDHDWHRVTRLATGTLAAAVTLIALMAVLFLDSRQALLQAVVLGIELTSVVMVARWHMQLRPPAGCEQPG